MDGVDPFDPAHPSLNHRRVSVRASTLDGYTYYERDIHWDALMAEERLTLERLLAKACQPRWHAVATGLPGLVG